MPVPISGLSSIAHRYDVALCDVWGVIHNGRESFPAACEALTTFQAQRGLVVLISNAPRPATAVYDQLDMLAVPKAAWSGFVTSGDATRALLSARAASPVWTIGPDRDAALYDGLNLTFAGQDEAGFICCTGPFDDTNDKPEDYRERFERAVARDMTFICANPDRVVQRGDELIYCAGALADLYTELGGEVIMAGKPYAATYDLALSEAEKLLGRPLDKARVLCIGDGIGTDVLGANNQGLDCLYISGGIHAAEGDTGDLLARAGAHAAWSLAGLAW